MTDLVLTLVGTIGTLVSAGVTTGLFWIGMAIAWTAMLIGKSSAYYQSRPSAQKTRIYCPECQNEMIADDSSTYEYDAEGILLHCTCGSCNELSIWDFDAPCPLLLSHREAE